MKIRYKLFMSMVLVAVVSMSIALYFSINSISKRYQRIADELIRSARLETETLVSEHLGDLVRKSLFLSELKEVVDNIDQPGNLAAALEFKNFFFANINIKIIDGRNRNILEFNNSSITFIDEKNQPGIPLLASGRDPLLREAGIFKIGNHLVMLAVSPIVDPETFALKGFVLLETPLNLEFADLIKAKTKADIVIFVDSHPEASTLFSGDQKAFFPPPASLSRKETEAFQLNDQPYLLDRFAIADYFKKDVGWIMVAVNIEQILVAKKLSVQSLWYGMLPILLFIILISMAMGNRLASSIVKFGQSAEKIAAGDFNARVDLKTKDEIGELAKSFNRMSESLYSQRNQILELKQFFEKIIEFSPASLIICSESAEVIMINPAAGRLLHSSNESVKGANLFKRLGMLEPLKEDFFRVMLSGLPFNRESYPVTFEDGTEKLWRLMFFKIPQADAPVEVVRIEDVSEKQELEEKLVHAKKLGALGELISRFTHEFNNIMTSLLGQLAILKNEVGSDHPAHRRTILTEEVAMRALNLGRDMLQFSRKEKLVEDRLDVKQIVETAINLLDKTIQKWITIEKHFKTEPLLVFMNKEKILLALFNVFINAKDAIINARRDRGRIVVTAERLFIARMERDFVRISISDNGTGIDEKVLSRIFEPYFTTKGEKGTGLGLSTVKEIIQENHGWIEIETEMNSGTTIILYLPALMAAS